jgi:hypothetical protein
MNESLSYTHLMPGTRTAFTAGRDCPLPCPVVQAHQVHGTRVAVVLDGNTSRDELEGYDALTTNVRGVTIGVRTADCVPILLHDPVRHAVAAVHSGWRGTVADILGHTIATMRDIWQTDARDLVAVIGPSISRQSFQVGQEVADAFARQGFPMQAILTDEGPRQECTMHGGLHIDLWEACRWLLVRAGMDEGRIHVTGQCTYLQSDLFYSARREGNRHDARNITAIGL